MTTPRLKDWREVIDLNFPARPITEATVRRAREYKGQIRRPYTPAEYEDRRNRVNNEFERS
jgi:hypothetical protein